MKENSYSKYRSINRLTNIVLIIFVILIIGVSLYSYRQYTFIDRAFNAIANEVIPVLADSAIAHTQLTSLAFLMSSYAKADSMAQLRIRELEVNEKIQEIKRLLQPNQQKYRSEITTIENEYEILKAFTLSRITNQNRLNSALQQLNVVKDNLLSRDSLSADGLKVVKLIADIVTIVSTNQMIEVRQFQKKINERIAEIPPAYQRLLTNTSDISEFFQGEVGIITLKLQSQRDKGRAEGQSNFLRRFIIDVAKRAEYDSYTFAKEQIDVSKSFANTATQQLSTTAIAYILSFVIALSLIIYIKVRLVSRLNQLKQALDNDDPLNVLKNQNPINDEIGQLTVTIIDYVETIADQTAKLTDLSYKDSLTLVGNRRAFTENMKTANGLAARNQLHLSVLIIDVDLFKQYNDMYGHIKGDECLVSIATAIQQCVKRSTDFVARYGGEEFACVMLGLDKKDTVKLANQILDTVRALDIPHASSNVSHCVTVSIGIYSDRQHQIQPYEILIQKADTALYIAKTSGRNQCALFDSKENDLK